MPHYLFNQTKEQRGTIDIRMTPQTVDEKIAAEIEQYHFLRSHQKELICHMYPSCESKQITNWKDVINYNNAIWYELYLHQLNE